MKIFRKFRRDPVPPADSRPKPTPAKEPSTSAPATVAPAPGGRPPYSLYTTQGVSKAAAAPGVVPPTPEVGAKWSKNVASSWASLRPRSGPAGKREVRTADRLEKMLLRLPPHAQLAFLVDLGLYAIAHGSGIEAEIFCATALLNVLRQHVTCTDDEKNEMFAFALDYDLRHDFTRTQVQGVGFAAYEAQLEGLNTNLGATFLGYVYLRHMREAPSSLAGEAREAYIDRLVTRYADLHKSSLFTP